MVDQVKRQQEKQQPQPPQQIGGMGGIWGFLQQLFGVDSNGNNFFASILSAFGLGGPALKSPEDGANVREAFINQQQAELADKGLYPSTGKFAQDGTEGSVMQHARRLQNDPNYARAYMKQALRDPQIDAIDVMKMQGAMNKLGYDSGDVDGRMDNQTRAALNKYLKDHPAERRAASAEVIGDSKQRTGITGWFAQAKDTVMSAKDHAFAPSVTPGSVKGLLDIIGEHESKGNYNAIWPKTSGNGTDFTKMTVNEVLAYQKHYTQVLGKDSSAVGKYQIIQKTLRGLKDDMGLTGNEKFDEAMQERMGLKLLERRGLNDFKNGKISAAAFQSRVAHEWASMPVDASGRGAYDGDSVGNKAAAGVAKPVELAINNILKPAPEPIAVAAKTQDIDFGRKADVRNEGMAGVAQRVGLTNAFTKESSFFDRAKEAVGNVLDSAKDAILSPIDTIKSKFSFG